MCLFLTRYFDEKLKIKRLSKVNRKPRVLNFRMLHNANEIKANLQRQKINLQKIPSFLYFRTIFGLFCLDILYYTKQTTFLAKYWLSQFQAGPYPPNPRPGICRVFVIQFWRSCKCPTMGLKNGVQLPHPRTTPKLYFQQISCNFHIYGKSVIILSKCVRHPTQVAPSRLL